MNIRQWTIWIILVSLFILNQYIERVLHVYISFLYSYFDDMLAVPVTLGAYQLLMTDILRKKTFRIHLPMVIICIVGFIFHFEFLMPHISTKYTYDPLDVVIYISGGLFYLLVFRGSLPFRKIISL